MASITIYPLDNYKIGKKDGKPSKDMTPPARLSRMEAKYENEGLRRTVEGVLLIHQHEHPHVLLLQFGPSAFRLPGGRLRPGETEEQGLLRKLDNKLAPAVQDADPPSWEVGQELAQWWRPNFDVHQYPYLPVHISRPKESRKVFLIHLPKQCTFAISKTYNIVAVPLYDLYANEQRYGPVVAAIPLLLARFSMSCEVALPPEIEVEEEELERTESKEE